MSSVRPGEHVVTRTGRAGDEYVSGFELLTQRATWNADLDLALGLRLSDANAVLRVVGSLARARDARKLVVRRREDCARSAAAA